MFRRLSTTALLLLCAASAQTTYTVIPGAVDSNGFPTSSAKFCVHSKRLNGCYTPPSSQYKFGLNAQAIDLPEWKGLTIFTAEFSGGGSGTLTSFALFDLRRLGKLTNLLPEVALTNQSEYRFWSIPERAMPIFVTADFVWQEGETHFGPHHYAVSSYLYDGSKYNRIDRYVTQQKYPGLDQADRIDVLEKERASILERLEPRAK